MGFPAIRRRVRNLESVFVIDRFAGYPPLTPEEIEALAGRMVEDKKWSEEEAGRVARQCPIIQGELLFTVIQGEVFLKRYPGVDLACI